MNRKGLIDRIEKHLAKRKVSNFLGKSSSVLNDVWPELILALVPEIAAMTEEERNDLIIRAGVEIETKMPKEDKGANKGGKERKTGKTKDVNIAVRNEAFDDSLAAILFSGEPFEIVDPETDMWSIVTEMGLFPSKGQARKNWNKTGQEIPTGFTELEKLGKLNHTLTIWNPIGE
jgi:hypothetical protein